MDNCFLIPRPFFVATKNMVVNNGSLLRPQEDICPCGINVDTIFINLSLSECQARPWRGTPRKGAPPFVINLELIDLGTVPFSEAYGQCAQRQRLAFKPRSRPLAFWRGGFLWSMGGSSFLGPPRLELWFSFWLFLSNQPTEGSLLKAHLNISQPNKGVLFLPLALQEVPFSQASAGGFCSFPFQRVNILLLDISEPMSKFEFEFPEQKRTNQPKYLSSRVVVRLHAKEARSEGFPESRMMPACPLCRECTLLAELLAWK